MPRTSRNWRPMKTRMWPPCMAGERKCSARTPWHCAKGTSPSPWKTAKLWLSSWRKKNEKHFDGCGALGADSDAGHGIRFHELHFVNHRECFAGKGLGKDRRLLLHP